MRIAEQIGHILGISERQVHRRLNDRETVALATLKAILVNGSMGQRLESAMHQLEGALPDAKRVDPAFAQVVEELAYRIKQWQNDSAAHELDNYWYLTEPIKRDDYAYRNVPYAQFQEESKNREKCRLEELATLRKKLTGSAEPPPPEPEEPEKGPPQSELPTIGEAPRP